MQGHREAECTRASCFFRAGRNLFLLCARCVEHKQGENIPDCRKFKCLNKCGILTNVLFLSFCSSTCKIIISNLGPSVKFEDIEHLLQQHGVVVACDKLTSKDPTTQTVQITFETPEQAQE